MKYVLSLALIFAAHLAFAKTSAQLDATQDVKIQIENQSGLKFKNMILKPRLSCWTTDPEGGGEASTTINDARVPFSYYVGSLNSSIINASVKIEDSAAAEAPKKRSLFSASRCGAGVLMVTQEEGKADGEILAQIGAVSSKSANENLTTKFVDELRGQYLLKMTYGGETYCSDIGARCPYCQLTLFKKTPEGLKELDRSSNLETKNCTK
jgi:hypothetical protein